MNLIDSNVYSFTWTNQQKSLLIESILTRIPIDTFWMELYEDNFLIVDGSKRLLTLKTFINDGFKLSGLTWFSELNGLNYSEIPRNLQRRILETEVIVFEVWPAPQEIKGDLYRRIK